MKRWLQPDTVDLLRYTYTSGDPVNLVDPSGREPVAPVPSAAEWFQSAGGSPSWAAFEGGGAGDRAEPPDPDPCRGIPYCAVVWGERVGKSPEQLKEEAERDHWDFLSSTGSVRADNARMAALGAAADGGAPREPWYERAGRRIREHKLSSSTAAAFTFSGAIALTHAVEAGAAFSALGLAGLGAAVTVGAAVIGVGFLAAGIAIGAVVLWGDDAAVNRMENFIRRGLPRRRRGVPRRRRHCTKDGQLAPEVWT